MANPFDYVNAITFTKKQIVDTGNESDLTEKEYVAFIVNKSLSYFIDTVLYANEMNRNAHIDSKLQFDYLVNSIRPKRRFSKWSKKLVNPEVDLVREYYQCNYKKAAEIHSLLTPKDITLIKTKLQKGGNTK